MQFSTILFHPSKALVFSLLLLQCSSAVLADNSSIKAPSARQSYTSTPNNQALLKYNFEFIRQIYPDPDHHKVLAQADNGYSLVSIDLINNKITLLVDNMYLNYGNYNHPAAQAKALNFNNFIYANPINSTIEAISPSGQRILVAGKPPANVAEADARTFSRLADIENYTSKQTTIPIQQAEFNVPLDIVPIQKQGWIVLNNGGHELKFIDQSHNVFNLRGLESLQSYYFKGVKSDQNGMLWLYNDTEVVQYDFNTQKIIQLWNNNSAIIFDEISDLAISPQGIFIADSIDYSIKKLLPNNKTERIFTSICNEQYKEKHGYRCNPKNVNKNQSLHLQPRYLSTNFDGNGLFISANNALYELLFDGKLTHLAGVEDTNIYMTDEQQEKEAR